MAPYDDEIGERPRRSCLRRVVGFFAALTLLGCVAFFAAPLAGFRVVWPSSVNRAAEQLGSGVATSAKTIVPFGKIIGAPNSDGPRPQIVPAKGAALHVTPQTFTYDGVKYSVTAHVDPTVYWGAHNSSRLMVERAGESDQAWSEAYYLCFANDPAQKPAIEDVITQLKAIRDKAHLDSDQYLELIAKYVQSIPYDQALWDSGKGVQRFPVETLVDGKGLCGDKSVLLSVLLAHEGYSAALLDFTPEKHMAVGVRGPGGSYGQTGWLFLETTAPGYVSDVPKSYVGGMKLTSEPYVIEVGTGTQEYGAAGDVARIVAARVAAQPAADELLRSAKKRALTVAEANAINRKLDLAYQATSSLQSNVVDARGRPVGKFMDRVTALRWIDKNAWWL
jgi:hypothetical protein